VEIRFRAEIKMGLDEQNPSGSRQKTGQASGIPARLPAQFSLRAVQSLDKP
jgi:hypothetical protein